MRQFFCCWLIIIPLLFSMEAKAQAIKGQSMQTHTIRLGRKHDPGKGKPLLAFISDKEPGNSDTLVNSFFAFLLKQKEFACEALSAGDLAKKPSAVNKYKVVVYYKDKHGPLPEALTAARTVGEIVKYLENGGCLLLSGFAMHYLVELGLEKLQPYDSLKQCNDESYGRKLGFHAFLDHPLFAGMNGGAYILRPMKDQKVGLCGYFGNVIPQGKVAGVDWDYIFLREESRILMEYSKGSGKVLAVGGYMDFSQPNLNSLHLEKFTQNCLSWLSGGLHSPAPRYWDYSENTVTDCDPEPETDRMVLRKPASVWPEPEDPLVMERRYSSDEYWDAAGERILAMGTENGGIEEVWAHPFMAFRDYEVGLKFDYKDSIYWLSDQRPEIYVHPGYLCRQYKFPRAYLKEIVVTDPSDPAGVLHYEYRGVYGAEVFIKFKSNLRMMWPYSEKATGGICHSWVPELDAFRIADRNGLMSVYFGTNKPAKQKLAGKFSGFSIDKNYKASGIFSGEFQAAFLLQYRLEPYDGLDVIYAAGSEGGREVRACFERVATSPDDVYSRSLAHIEGIFKNRLTLRSPDQNFNKGYAWSLVSADKFFVRTPGMGGSLVAGYATTKHGWDGAQKVSGRPGYAWYFGRDGQWSGLALLDAGDYEKVKSELEFYQKYQDLNGKILHEASTSGIIHYDASDATPLYLLLAGRYFRFTHDTAWLRQSWPFIRKSVEFCFSTDTDKDHLIENTNVGHGWVEGGELYGSHATLYMQGCWAEALKEVAGMMEAMLRDEGRRTNDEGRRTKDEGRRTKDEVRIEEVNLLQEYGTIRHLINSTFWDSSSKFFSYGMNSDGAMRSESTVLPAVPLGFGLADPDKAAPVLQQYASNAFTTNWGVRILREDSKWFKPTGYHYGSVWPLFTGWASMADYRYGAAVQGFSHLLNNLNVYRTFSLGHVQEVLNGAVYRPSGVCANQCWSATMVVQPALEGLLGLDVDAGKMKVRLAPAVPADWDSLEARNIRFGDRFIHMKYRRSGNTLTYRFVSEYREKITVELAPLLPPGTRILWCRVNQKDVQFTSAVSPEGVRAGIDFRPDGVDLVEIGVESGICVLPEVPGPKAGYPAEGLRIISASLTGDIYSVTAEGLSGSMGLIRVWSNFGGTDGTENGLIESDSGKISSFRLSFPDSGSKYSQTTLKIRVK
jgi:glycogen debranching enzyme